MGRKIFVSYKHSDANVYALPEMHSSTARDYVNQIEALLDDSHVFKGEHDGEDLSQFKDSTIESHLRDKIFDSSVTLVVISGNMKDLFTPESDQWIPWEIAYSLSEHKRAGRASLTNAVLAVVLPDRNGSYSYYLEDKGCCASGCRNHKTATLFQILRDNMFNEKSKTLFDCSEGSNVFTGEPSYIPSIKWEDFKVKVDPSIERAVRINEDIEQYTITKTVA